MSYIWEKEIQTIEGTKVTFVDGTEKVFTPKQIEYVVTDEMKDATQFHDLVTFNIAEELLWVLKTHNMRKWDLDTVLNLIVSSFNNKFLIAIGKKFGTFEEGKHASYFEENITMSDLFN
jgi:hypothetical protein